MEVNRRKFLFGLGAGIVAAPAIVRVAANLMQIRPPPVVEMNYLGLAPLKIEGMDVEFDTANLRYATSLSWGINAAEWRGIHGSTGS